MLITCKITWENAAVRVIHTLDDRVLACVSFSHELKLMINFACQKLRMYMSLADNMNILERSVSYVITQI